MLIFLYIFIHFPVIKTDISLFKLGKYYLSSSSATNIIFSFSMPISMLMLNVPKGVDRLCSSVVSVAHLYRRWTQYMEHPMVVY